MVERFADQSATNHLRLDKVTRHVGVTNAMLHPATEAMRRRPLSLLPGRVLAPLLDRATRLQTRRTGRRTPNHRNASSLSSRPEQGGYPARVAAACDLLWRRQLRRTSGSRELDAVCLGHDGLDYAAR